MKREISVIVPFHGDSAALGSCLSALGKQTVRARMQIVLSVDGPDCPEGVSHLTDLIVTNSERLGPAVARNRGWRASEGEFVLFTDSDCVPAPDWAEKMTAPLKQGWEASKGVYTRGGERLIQRLAQVEFMERYLILKKARRITIADTYSAGFARSALERVGGFDESFPVPDHEDVDLSWRVIRSGGKICFVADAGVTHTHRKTWASYFALKTSRGAWRIRVLRRFPEMAFSDGYTPQSMKLQMALAPLLPVFLAAAAIQPLAPLVWIAVFLMLSAPLILVAVRYDPGVVWLIPAFAWWRGVALAAGAVAGVLKGDGICSRR